MAAPCHQGDRLANAGKLATLTGFESERELHGVASFFVKLLEVARLLNRTLRGSSWSRHKRERKLSIDFTLGELPIVKIISSSKITQIGTLDLAFTEGSPEKRKSSSW